MKKIVLILATTLTASMAHSNIYNYLCTASTMNIFINTQTTIENVNLLENALKSKEHQKKEPVKIEAPSFLVG
jgi:hypothetical protein